MKIQININIDKGDVKRENFFKEDCTYVRSICGSKSVIIIVDVGSLSMFF